jgi:hypothetical protein
MPSRNSRLRICNLCHSAAVYPHWARRLVTRRILLNVGKLKVRALTIRVPPSLRVSYVFILNIVKVVCFATVLQVLILRSLQLH